MTMTRSKKDFSLVKVVVIVFVVIVVLFWTTQYFKFLSKNATSVSSETKAQENIKLALQLLDQGKKDEAAKIIDPLINLAKQGKLPPATLELLAQTEKIRENTDTAIELLQKAYDASENQPERPRIAIQLGEIMLQAGKNDEAAAIFQKIIDSAPAEFHAPALMGLGKIHKAKNELIEARDFFRKACSKATWGSEEWEKAAKELGDLNVALIFSPQPTPESMVYTVQKGDTLVTIGLKLNTTLGLLTRANGLPENATLSVGQRLKYTPKDFYIVIERSKCRLFLMDKDGLFKMYAVGLGMPGHETALGKFKIGNKQKDPPWFKPGEGEIPPGDPRNELGTRWMPLIPLEEGLPTDLGIHGTTRPETVGGYYSHGCARLKREDVEELYDLVVRATPVEIVETFQPSSEASPQDNTGAPS